MPAPASLQISLAPPDVRHASLIVPHQLHALGDQVDEVLLVLDLRRGHGRSWRRGWSESVQPLRALANSLAAGRPNARVLEVDYSPAAVRRVAQRFFSRDRIPAKDLRGGPLFSYFFALSEAQHDHVLHLDSDMLLGGAGPSWVSEAVELLRSRPEVLCVCPLAGPPARDGSLRGQEAYAPTREATHRFVFRDFTSRVFLCERTRLAPPQHPLALKHDVPWWGRVSAGLTRRSTVALPERLISRAMRERGLVRVDLLGAPPGMWTLHPLTHDASFLAALPQLIARIEREDVTEEQRGRYNLDPTMLPPADLAPA